MRGFKSKLLNAALSLLGSGSAYAAACGTTRTRRATGGRTSTRGGSSTSRGSRRPSRNYSPTDTASARTSSDPSSRTSEISGGRSSDSGRTDFTPGNTQAHLEATIDYHKISFLQFLAHCVRGGQSCHSPTPHQQREFVGHK